MKKETRSVNSSNGPRCPTLDHSKYVTENGSALDYHDNICFSVGHFWGVFDERKFTLQRPKRVILMRECDSEEPLGYNLIIRDILYDN